MENTQYLGFEEEDLLLPCFLEAFSLLYFPKFDPDKYSPKYTDKLKAFPKTKKKNTQKTAWIKTPVLKYRFKKG